VAHRYLNGLHLERDEGSATIAALVEAGADVIARFTGPRVLTARVESTGPLLHRADRE
jgi:hypothetical protein